jgi:translation initiation factor 2 beta subunit (eIF-2beta)/eIF-5
LIGTTDDTFQALENAIDDIYDTHSIITGDNGGKSFIPGKLETSWVDEYTDFADTFVICKDCSSFPSFEAALFVPRDDLSFLKCEDKTKSLTTASALPSLIKSIND